jgi:protein-disulfide isomerase
VTVAPDEHTLGSPTAPVTVIEYAAPSCPICALFDQEIFPQLKSTYIDTGKVYYVFRVYPLRAADGAAEAIARCLPKDQYFSFIEMLFQKQSQWDPEFGVSDAHAALVELSRVAGMTAEKVDGCIEDKTVQARINEIAQDGQTRFAIQATPTFIIDGKAQEPGALPWNVLQPAIEAALKTH